MEIINLTREQPFGLIKRTCFAFNLKFLKEVWIFNCCQGCQHKIGTTNIKFSQISKIIITDLHIKNVSGLLGLLSTLSLIKRTKALHIYSPKGLEKYLELGTKYSKTNFRYNLYFHILKTGLIIRNDLYQIYAFANKMRFEFLIFFQEQSGKFKLNKAKNFNIIQGPLYGKLKKGFNLLLPDGLILDGKHFKGINKSGEKLLLIYKKYHNRNSVENSKQCQKIQLLL